MALSFQIKVMTPTSAGLVPETGARVSLIAEASLGSNHWPFAGLDETHSHTSNGAYAPKTGNDPADGKWLLVVSKAGMSPVVQRLTTATKKGILRANPGWKSAGTDLARTAATVSIVKYDQKPGSTVAAYVMVIVTLVPRSEVIMVASHNHMDGTNYALFCEGRRNKLFRLGTANSGTIVTTFVEDSRKKLTMAKSSDPSNRSWILVDEEVKHPIAPHVGRPVPAEELSILDFYREIDDRGKDHPGTVLEAGIFGHAYFGGPILWNTWDRAPSNVDRDPEDLDGRQKDWLATGSTMLGLPNLKAAFHSNGSFRIWGCAHMETVIAEGNAGNTQRKAGTARDKFFSFSINSGVENATLDHLKRSIAESIAGQRIRHMKEHGDASGTAVYGGMAAQFLQIPTWLAPPGMGSLYRQTTQDGWEGYISPSGENTGLRAFYLAEFGASFVEDDDGYLDYNQARQVALTDPPWSTERWARFRDDDISRTILRLPSGMELHRTSGSYRNPELRTFNGVSGHLYVANASAPQQLEERDSDRVLVLANRAGEDCGVFVQSDGAAILMQKVGSGTWVVNTAPLPVVQMEFGGGTVWTPNVAVPRPPVTNGELERVTPAWYW